MITEKNTISKKVEFSYHQYSYHIVTIQGLLITTKIQWFRAQNPHDRFIVKKLDSTNSIHAFNRFEIECYLERIQCHFRFIDLARDTVYTLGTPKIQYS